MFCRKHDCRWVGCLLWLFTALLGVLLLVQIPLVALLTLDHELGIPDRWVEKAINHGLGERYSVSLGSATLNRNGTVELNEVTLRNELGRRVAKAESLQVDFYLPSIVFGGFHPEQIKATKVDLFDPRGPLGGDEEVLSMQALNLIRARDTWRLDDFKIEWENLKIVGAGTLHSSFLDSSVETRDEPIDPLHTVLETVSAITPQLSRLKKPFIQVHLNFSANADTRVEVAMIAERAELPFDIGLEDEIRLTSSALISSDRIAPGPTLLRCETILYEHNTTIRAPSIRLVPSTGMHSLETFLASSSAEISASLISSPEATLEYPTLRIEPERALKFKLHGQAGIFGNPFSLEIRADVLRRLVTVGLEGKLSIADAIQHPAIPEVVRDFPLEFVNGAFLQIETECSFDQPIPEKLRFRAETESFDIKGFTGIHGRAEGSLYVPNMVLEVDKLSAQKPDYHLEGSYFHDFLSNEFRFLIRGGFLPGDISSWMRDWWDRIWVDFVIREVPYVDLDIKGDWDHHDDRRIFGGLRFRDIALKGMDIESGYASLRSLPYLFELFDLRAFRPEGEASGYLAIFTDWETRDNKLELYDFTSNFQFSEILPLFGEQLAANLSDFDLTGAPDLQVRATMRPKITGKPKESDFLAIDASTDKPLTYREIQLDALSLSAVYSNEILRIDPVQFELGGGKGEGWIVRRHEDAQQGKTSAQLTFKDGVPSDVVTAIPQLTKMVGDKIDREEDLNSEDYKLDFSIEFSGDLEKPESLLGEGNMDLLTPNLANIRLLGIFSRISEELPLPITLGSFKFERVSTSFLLNRGLVEFPDLTLYSPSSELLASGAYDMKGQTIDFNAQMQLLGGVKFPILAQLGTLLSPMGKVFEFRVWGELEDLNWRLYLDPRSWN